MYVAGMESTGVSRTFHASKHSRQGMRIITELLDQPYDDEQCVWPKPLAHARAAGDVKGICVILAGSSI